jgi:hypothetical protein
VERGTVLEFLVRRSRDGRGVRMRARRHLPIAPLVTYYAALIGVGVLLILFVPGAEEAITAPIMPSRGISPFGEPPMALPQETPWGGPFGRLAVALFAVFGAVLLALPVAGIYMHTRRLQYDPSLVQTMIVLPIVVAGVVLVVKNSLALAFALAGIVAGVRFRQKLNEPKDAVYVLLSLGLGLAAAVQALDVALAVSLAFNVVVLLLWRFDPSAATPSHLAMGDLALLADSPSRGEGRAMALDRKLDTDGILIVHAPEPDAARRAIDLALSGAAKEWHVTSPVATPQGMHRFEVLLRLDDVQPLDLVADLEERWGRQIAAAEYMPFRYRPDEDEDDDD